MSGSRGHRQRGGMMSLLLSLLAVGLLAYFALRGTAGQGTPGSLANDRTAVSCEQQISKLMARTGGQGPEYKTGYEALPSTCRGLVPAPEALAPRAVPET